MRLTPKLKTFHRRVSDALPGITVDERPYDIGYWSWRAKLEVPARVAKSRDLAALRNGIARAKIDAPAD